MFTILFLILLTLAKPFDVNSHDTVYDTNDYYEIILDNHEQLLNNWHQIYNDSSILQVVNYFDSLDVVNSDSKVKWNKARSHHILGSIYAANKDYTMAMEHFVISLKSLDDVPNYIYDIQKNHLTGLMYKKISSMFLFCEFFDKSLDMLLESIDKFHACNDSSHLLVEYLTLGSFCDMLDEDGSNPDTNMYYIRKAENYLSKFPEQSYERAYYDYCLSYYFRSINYHDTALVLRAKALRNMPKYNSFYYSMNRAAAYAFYAEQEYDSALYYALEAFRSPDLFDKRDAAEGLSEIYKELGDEKESSKYADIYRESQRKCLDLKIQNATIGKTYDTYLNYKIMKENGRKQSQSIWVVLILLAFVLSIIIYFYISKNRSVNNEALANTLFLERWNTFQETEIFISIIERCDDNKDLMGDTIMYFKRPLTNTELSTYKATIDSLFNDFTNRFSLKYPDMTKVELDYCFISILPLTEIQKAGLLSLSYQGIVSRRKRVTSKLKESLQNQKLIDFMKKSLKDGLI
jgi:hypothetical protein